jgi:hypothetical protein
MLLLPRQTGSLNVLRQRRKGLKPEYTDKEGRSLLSFAAGNGWLEAAEFLLEEVAKLNRIAEIGHHYFMLLMQESLKLLNGC